MPMVARTNPGQGLTGTVIWKVYHLQALGTAVIIYIFMARGGVQKWGSSKYFEGQKVGIEKILRFAATHKMSGL